MIFNETQIAILDDFYIHHDGATREELRALIDSILSAGDEMPLPFDYSGMPRKMLLDQLAIRDAANFNLEQTIKRLKLASRSAGDTGEVKKRRFKIVDVVAHDWHTEFSIRDMNHDNPKNGMSPEAFIHHIGGLQSKSLEGIEGLEFEVVLPKDIGKEEFDPLDLCGRTLTGFLPQSGTGEGENIIAFEALIHECLKTDLYREDFVFQRLTNDAIDRLRSMKDFPRSQEGEG